MKKEIGFTANQQVAAGATSTAPATTKAIVPAPKADPATTNALKDQLTRQLVLQTTGFHIGPQAEEKYAEKPVNVIMAKNGVFRLQHTPVADFISQLAQPLTVGTGTTATTTTSIPGLPEMKAGVFLKVPKIPWKYWLMALSFYRDVHKKDGTEASLLFFWNHNSVPLPTEYAPSEEERNKAALENRNAIGDAIQGVYEDGQLIIYVPKQKNSSSLSVFDFDPMVPWLRTNTTPLCETHSHHTMSAFFSGTDDANENMTQFYGVFGTINNAEPAFIFRHVCGRDKIVCDKSMLFDVPRTKIIKRIEIEGQVMETVTDGEFYNGPWPTLEYPSDWMGQHSKSYVVSASSNYNKGYNGYNGGSYGGYDGEDYSGAHHGRGSGTGGAKKNNALSSGKSASAGSSSQTSASGASGANASGEIATRTVNFGSSTIEITAHAGGNGFALDEVENLLQNLCESGYDVKIAQAIEEARQDYRGV